MKCTVAALLSSTIAASPAQAALEKDWHFSGFLNQTLISTSDNNFFGHTDDRIDTAYAEAGILLVGKLSPELTLSTQALMRHAGELDNGHPRIDHLLLTYRFEDSYEHTQGIRIGRGKQHFGVYNETRDVPFTRPGILMPQSCYFDRARNTLQITDEVSYFSDIHAASGTYSVSTGLFKSVPDGEEVTDYFNMDNTIKTRGDFGTGIQIMWRSPLEQWFIGLAMGRIRYQIETDSTSLFNPDGSFNVINSDGRQEIYATNLFGQFTQDNWILTAEAALINSAYYHLNSTADKFSSDGINYYFQAEYNLNAKHELFARYDVTISDKDDPDGEKFAASAYGKILNLPAYSQYAYDYTIGYGFRPQTDWLLRLELHNVEGTNWTSHRENPNSAQLAKYWNMALAQLSYRF